MTMLNELKAGDTITIDNGFTCAMAGDHTVLMDDNGPSFRCDCGLHYLDGQVGDDGHLVGIVNLNPTPRA